MDQDLEELVARASDPRWIPAIYEYCDHRCGRCRFNDRCFTFAEQMRDDDPCEDGAEAVAASLERALGQLRALAEREGIDPAGSSPEPEDKMNARVALVDEDLAARVPRAMEFVRPGFDGPIPGVVRPWSLSADDERGDRRFLAASGILTKLKDFGRGLIPRFKRSSEP